MAGSEQDQGFPSSEIVRASQAPDYYVPSGSIEERQAEELALVGFSRRLPATMQELNEAITALDTVDAFQGYRFTLTPDYDKPRVAVDARYVPNVTVILEATVGKHADLSIRPREHRFLSQATLPDLKSFFQADEIDFAEPIFTATPTMNTHGEVPVSNSRPLSEIENEADLRNLGVKPTAAKLTAECLVKESPTKVVIDMGWLDPRYTRTNEMLFRLRQIEASGHSHEVEALLGGITVLLSKHSL